MAKFCTILFFLVLFSVKPVVLHGQVRIVEGTVIKIEKQKKRAFNDIPVTLYSIDKKSRSDPSITDINGSYYFYNIPEGGYKLEVWIYGVVDKNNIQNRAKVYDISVDYKEANTFRGRLLLKLAPVQITL